MTPFNRPAIIIRRHKRTFVSVVVFDDGSVSKFHRGSRVSTIREFEDAMSDDGSELLDRATRGTFAGYSVVALAPNEDDGTRYAVVKAGRTYGVFDSAYEAHEWIDAERV